MRDRTRKLNNLGLTLVELLVAVAILGVIVAPLLHSFVTSAYTARKSRVFGDATVAAQNIIEAIQAMDADLLLADSGNLSGSASFYERKVEDGVEKFVPSASGEAVKDELGRYYIGMPVSAGNSSFDALITLDASSEINEMPVTEYTELLPVFQNMGADNPDTLAKMEFDEALSAAGGVNPRLERTISITVEEEKPAGETFVEFPVSIDYKYSGGFFYGEENSQYYSFFYEYNTGTYSKRVDKNSISAEKPAFSLFFFFNTFYGIGADTKDTILIYNNINSFYNETKGIYNNLPFNLFLIRQKTGETPSRDATYKSCVYQYEPYGLGESEDENGIKIYLNACKVYTNLNANLNDGSELGSFDYRVYRNALWYTPATAVPRLAVSSIRDRLFYINVKLFPKGSGFTGKPVASIDASKLD